MQIIIVTIGRDSNNNLVIKDDRTVSRNHAILTIGIGEQKGKYTLHDFHSGNGTKVNGVVIQSSTVVTQEDTIELGLHVLTEIEKERIFNANQSTKIIPLTELSEDYFQPKSQNDSYTSLKNKPDLDLRYPFSVEGKNHSAIARQFDQTYIPEYSEEETILKGKTTVIEKEE